MVLKFGDFQIGTVRQYFIKYVRSIPFGGTKKSN